jgi:hypothetical protein
MVAVTRVPAPGAERTSSDPPAASTRSTMLTRPTPRPIAAMTSNPTPSSAIVSVRPAGPPRR